MKNPLRELTFSAALLLLLFFVLLQFTGKGPIVPQATAVVHATTTEKTQLLTYIEIEATTALQGLEISCGDQRLSNAPLEQGELLEVKGKLTFKETECVLHIKAHSETFPSSVRIRLEPERLAHREKVLWIDASVEQDVRFSWK